MSRLIDKLVQVSQVASQPLGFGRTQSVSRPKMLIIASLAEADIGNSSDRVAGADAGLLPVARPGSGVKRLKEVCQAMPAIPWGGRLKNIGRAGVKQVVEAGGDFVVFPAANTPLRILEDDKVGRILEIEASLEGGLLRTVDELPADAVLIASEQQGEHSLTWRHLMSFKRFADLLTKPLLVPIPSDVTANELQALWETGVDGVVVEVEAGQPAGKLKELRQMIDSLDLSSHRKRGKTEALLPYAGSEAGIVTEDEEEEE